MGIWALLRRGSQGGDHNSDHSDEEDSSNGAGNASFLRHVMLNPEHFTKTGLGQTAERLGKKAFSAEDADDDEEALSARQQHNHAGWPFVGLSLNGGGGGGGGGANLRCAPPGLLGRRNLNQEGRFGEKPNRALNLSVHSRTHTLTHLIAHFTQCRTTLRVGIVVFLPDDCIDVAQRCRFDSKIT